MIKKNIAVLIPTYKPGSYIHSCLQSLEKQTLTKESYKVYIALNGPKENFEEIVQSALEDTNFDYEFFYLEKAGVSNARNHLIDNSTEPFVTFVDDDDCISPTYLESLLSVSSIDTIGISNVYNFEQDIGERKPNYIGQAFLKLPDVEKSKLKSRQYYSSPCAKLIHRNIIGTTRFNTKLAIGEDALFMAELSCRVEAVRKTTETACYYVFEREGSATRQEIDKLKELQRIIYLLKQYGKMLLNFRYDSLFITTRIMATILHLKRLV